MTSLQGLLRHSLGGGAYTMAGLVVTNVFLKGGTHRGSSLIRNNPPRRTVKLPQV